MASIDNVNHPLIVYLIRASWFNCWNKLTIANKEKDNEKKTEGATNNSGANANAKGKIQ